MPCSSERIGSHAAGSIWLTSRKIVLEDTAAEQAEPGQGGTGGVAQVAAGEFQRGEQRGVAALVGVLLHRLQQLAKVRTNLLRSQAAEVRADQLQRERMVREVAQQGIELVAGKPGIAELDAVALENAVQQPQAVGPRQAVQLEPPGAGKSGLARTAGDEHAAFARSGGQVTEEIGQKAAFVVGVGAAVLRPHHH